ncbi:MAG: tetratricopeptide repeat protein [Anaerolineales bacterium]|nr:tetratricopeptide repeat protein [Anaerolineales bacterium]
MNISQRRSLFRRRDEFNIYRMFFWIILILGGIWLIRSVQSGDVKPLFQPTATPTRFSSSFVLEGDAQFTSGQLEDIEEPDGSIKPGAISVYLQAVKVDPNNAQVWAQLARVQTYSSAMLVNLEERKARLEEALVSAEKAVELAPDDSNVHAIYAFTLDWNANSILIDDPRVIQKLLTDAEQEAARALQLDNSNTLALALSAEILVDQQKWTLAQQNIEKALASDASLMDVHRVNAYVMESLGEYALAIESYDRAIAITPNLTFLHLYAGANYRRLAFDSPNEEVQTQLYEKSLEYFSQAARINTQLNVKDPVPYLSIAKTYSQMGQFFIAIRNVQRTIEFQPGKAEFYGELGVLYHKNRNYETGILALECAVRGCTAKQSCPARGNCGSDDVEAEVVGLPLNGSTVYYYDVYASELAALSTSKKNYCSEAMDIASVIEASEFDNDPNIAADIVVVRNICNSIDTPSATTTGEPASATGTPTATP